jgi:hypothetical protein
MRILGLQIFPSARPSEECGHHQWQTEPQTQVPNIIDFLSKTSPFALGILNAARLYSSLKGPSGQIRSAQEWYHWINVVLSRNYL